MEEWHAFQSLISLFCEASGLEVVSEKYCFIFTNVDKGECDAVKAVLDYHMVDFFFLVLSILASSLNWLDILRSTGGGFLRKFLGEEDSF